MPAFAIVMLVKSMSRHLKRVPRSFDPEDDQTFVVPDDAAVSGDARVEVGELAGILGKVVEFPGRLFIPADQLPIAVAPRRRLQSETSQGVWTHV